MNISLVGIDIAKIKFQLHGVDSRGKCVLKKQIHRGELLKYIVQLPKCLIAMEACSGANYWAREFMKLGHKVKLISPQYVKPFVKSNKNDANDAEAIVEAASRPSMRFVSIKTEEQQDIQSIHRIRERLITWRTSLCNQLRGLLAEHGYILPKGVSQLKKHLFESVLMGAGKDAKSRMVKEFSHELYDELLFLESKIDLYDKKLEEVFKNNEICQRLSKVEGIGVVSATLLATELSDPHLFKSGRHFAAYLGLVPRQHSSGGRNVLLGISKRGNCYLRGLLVHGGRSVVHRAAKKQDRRSLWVNQLKDRRGYNRAAVALANKNARIAWALVAYNADYEVA